MHESTFADHAMAAADYMRNGHGLPIVDHYIYMTVGLPECARRLANRHQHSFYANNPGVAQYETDWYFAILVSSKWQNPLFTELVDSAQLTAARPTVSVVSMPTGLKGSIGLLSQIINNPLRASLPHATAARQ